MQDQKKRLGDAKQLLISKFKALFIDYTKKDIDVFSFQITTALSAKLKKAEDDRMAEAVAKAKAEVVAAPAPEARGGLLGFFL